MYTQCCPGMSDAAAVGRAAVPRGVRVARLADASPAAPRRAYQSFGHGDHRCSRRRHQRLRRRHGTRQSRLQAYQSGALYFLP